MCLPVWASSPPTAAKENNRNGLTEVVPRKPDSLQSLHVVSALQVGFPSPLLYYFIVERLTGLRAEKLCLCPRPVFTLPIPFTLHSVPVLRAEQPCLIAKAFASF